VDLAACLSGFACILPILLRGADARQLLLRHRRYERREEAAFKIRYYAYLGKKGMIPDTE
jgi:hypothetical protein